MTAMRSDARFGLEPDSVCCGSGSSGLSLSIHDEQVDTEALESKSPFGKVPIAALLDVPTEMEDQIRWLFEAITT